MLAKNHLQGAIPSELGRLARLTELSLAANQLSGAIPLELMRLAELELLVLADNHLQGTIPPELGNLARLITLSLWGNQLTGAIPPELGRLANLKSLSLADNRLTGIIPPRTGPTLQAGIAGDFWQLSTGGDSPCVGQLRPDGLANARPRQPTYWVHPRRVAKRQVQRPQRARVAILRARRTLSVAAARAEPTLRANTGPPPDNWSHSLFTSQVDATLGNVWICHQYLSDLFRRRMSPALELSQSLSAQFRRLRELGWKQFSARARPRGWAVQVELHLASARVAGAYEPESVSFHGAGWPAAIVSAGELGGRAASCQMHGLRHACPLVAPAAPGNLTAGTVTGTSVPLSWDAVTGAAK